MINELKSIFGAKCSAINVNGETTEFFNVPTKPMKFCEAVSYSFDVPVRLINGNLGCPGARRCVGFDNDDKQLAHTISDNNKIPFSFIMSALQSIPVLGNIHHVNLGITEQIEKRLKPDLYILYLTPNRVTEIMHTLARQKIKPSIPPYSLLSVCGNVFVNCYNSHQVTISFGCPESRKHGGIENNEVVVGLWHESATLIIDKLMPGHTN